MILEVQHETQLEYSGAVAESMTEVRMEPVSDGEQSCHSFRLVISPQTELFRYQDGFGNRVHHFNLLQSHAQVRVLAASLVETHPQLKDLKSSKAIYPISLDNAPLEVFDYLKFRGPVSRTSRLEPVLGMLRPSDGTRLADLVTRACYYINGHFEYARHVTLASSPIDDVLEHGKGVCQDFTHLMIGILRAFDVPARYVSGYIHRPNKESQSHAWCEAWLPDLGWCGIDPTNDQLVNEHFVKVAVGRDFTDVPPNKGIYRGQAQEKIMVRVETQSLERLPSLTWQEQLPALNVPLTVIVPQRRGGEPFEEGSQQQQQ
ncbi:MAG: transglutaminase family protein [Gemmataceae bacterium]|nr:transglutaminase family protein [Gemmataceae bacterium]